MGNKGYDVSAAERLLYEGMEEARKCGILDRARFGSRENATARAPNPAVSPELRALTAELLHEIHCAPRDPSHPYWNYVHPVEWEAVRAEMPAAETSWAAGRRSRKFCN